MRSLLLVCFLGWLGLGLGSYAQAKYFDSCEGPLSNTPALSLEAKYAVLDAAAAFVASEFGRYFRFDEFTEIRIEEGNYWVVSRFLKEGDRPLYVAVRFDPGPDRVTRITGPEASRRRLITLEF